MKIKVGTRIITGYILLISLMVIGGITSFFIFKDIEKKEHHILDIKYKSVRASEKVMEGNLKSGMYIREYLLTGNEKSRGKSC